MTVDVVKLKSRGFLALSAHPAGCEAEVREQFDAAREVQPTGGTALVLGASTGYGLATRICAAQAGMKTIGVMLERPAERSRTASAGWYNSVAFHRHVVGQHTTFNADAFADSTKQAVINQTAATGPIGLLIYSIAAPVRTDPITGELHRSVLKPVDDNYTTTTIDLDKEAVREVTVTPADAAELRSTIAVMGGDDLERWVTQLDASGALAPSATIVAYTYVGPAMTWPIYRDGTVGHAKKHLHATVSRLDAQRAKQGGRAIVSVNKAVVTQASIAIPAVPLYLSLLFKVMKARGTHEGTLGQALRLFGALSGKQPAAVDDHGFWRLDTDELDAGVQAEVHDLWTRVNSQNFKDLSDFEGFRADFHRLYGFDVPSVDYDVPVEVDLSPRW